ncbi:MAG: hypothetical protein CM15mP71_0460 [Candidatus Poseidoniales archaeon]|nr:MAG: hypothetical protein CM15mP71_0460 [Candidatus Poseidoniales archaeon]
MKPIQHNIGYSGFRHSSGKAETVFSYTHDEIGMVRHKVKLEGNGVELEHSELLFNVVVDEYLVDQRQD